MTTKCNRRTPNLAKYLLLIVKHFKHCPLKVLNTLVNIVRRMAIAVGMTPHKKISALAKSFFNDFQF